MDPFKPKLGPDNGPEAKIRNAIVKYLENRQWVCKVTHGNIFQSGLPDLYTAHLQFGTRWIEVKNPEHYVFTRAQKEFFPKLTDVGVGIWVLVAATEEEYQKLFKKPNWQYYLHHLMK